MGLWSGSAFVVLLAAVLYFTAKDHDFEGNVLKISPPWPLTGKLAATPANTLTKIDQLVKGQVYGPECQVLLNGAIYSSTLSGAIIKIVDGKIVKSLEIYKNNPKCRKHKCSQPLGMRHWKQEKFVFADGYLGVFVVDFETDSFKQVFSASTVLGDWSNTFADDVDFIDEETIIFSDMTPKYGFKDFTLNFYDLAKDGRLIKLNLNTGAYEIIADHLLTPNGVITHPDKQSIIVSSTAASQLLRVYFAGPKKGSVEVFADGLPGIPDNVRATSSGETFWIALYLSAAGSRPIVQTFSEYPRIRKLISYYAEHLLPLSMYLASNHIVFIEMDFEGKVISSFHDLEGRLKGVTNIVDDGKYFYFGSVHHDYIGRALRP